MTKVFIIGSKRTPLGAFLGGLSTIPAPDLGGAAIDAALKHAGVAPDQVDSCYVGNVISAGTGQNLAKQAAVKGGLPQTVPCTHVDKVCCSSMKALTLAAQEIMLGDAQCCVVAGTENMSLTPRIVSGSRATQKMGPMTLAAETKAADAMIVDGLWDSFNDLHMGTLADNLAKECGITREEQDQFALRSFAKAKEGWETGKLDVIEVNGVKSDEVIPKLIPEKVPTLRPCFNKDGTVTAANSSALADGAVAAVVCSEEFAKKVGVRPIARLVAYADVGTDPKRFPAAPVDAARKVLAKAGMSIEDVDLWECNEAFAMAPLLFKKTLGIPEECLNVLGGAIAIGHPLGCSGLRIVNTLISALTIKQKRVGLAAICNGGGGATAVIVELL